MSLHTNKLPIYKVAYDLLSVAVDYAQNMPRPFRAVADRVRDLCIDIVLLILKANSVAQKTPYLDVLLEQVDELNLLLRLCQDKRFISKPQYAKAIELTASVGAQAYGWRRHYAASPAT
jgi:hypothetical protein